MDETFTPSDAQLLGQLREATIGCARLLCSLARLGKKMEREQLQRSEFLLSEVRIHPLYKGGRLAFDMLEIEDLMLNHLNCVSIDASVLIDVLRAGPRSAIRTFRHLGAALGGKADSLVEEAAQNHARGSGKSVVQLSSGVLPKVTFGDSSVDHGNGPASDSLEPKLVASDYLYDYVVLGFLHVLGLTIASPVRIPNA